MKTNDSDECRSCLIRKIQLVDLTFEGVAQIMWIGSQEVAVAKHVRFWGDDGHRDHLHLANGGSLLFKKIFFIFFSQALPRIGLSIILGGFFLDLVHFWEGLG